MRALLRGRRSFWFCGVVQGGVRWKGARFAFVRRRRYHSVCRSEESSVGGLRAASAVLPPGVRRPDSYTFRVVSETDTVAHLVRIRVGRVPDLMRFALCRTNRLKREASATMYVVGALAFAFVEEWNGYPLGSFLFAHLVAARRKVLASWSL